jgi:hypothetical protein
VPRDPPMSSCSIPAQTGLIFGTQSTA